MINFNVTLHTDMQSKNELFLTLLLFYKKYKKIMFSRKDPTIFVTKHYFFNHKFKGYFVNTTSSAVLTLFSLCILTI